MSARRSGLLALVGRVLGSWQLPSAIALLLLIAFAFWVWPTRHDWVVSTDGQRWPGGNGATRQVLWETPQPLDGLLPDAAPGSFLTPRLADGGTTLYFSYRPRGKQADVYRSRLLHGRWQRAEPVAELNTSADEIAATSSPDGRTLYLSSNRPGGEGGFDLYTAEWTGKGWSKPRNLGRRVNSPAHEYDPALTPDGTKLFFASNRAPQEKPAEGKAGKDELGVTVRSHPGLPQFDLYSSQRASLEEDWSIPEPLRAVNLPDANEGAPFVAPAGNFLYFASDRPARPGEERNLDLYRARLTDGTLGTVENLGPSVNSKAHETEPGLSPEGFTLVFSSDRDGANGLYLCKALEVHPVTEWDDSRWRAVMAWWKPVLFLTLLLAAVMVMLWYTHGWLMEKATAARFFLGSLLLHLLLLLIMGAVGVGRGILDHARDLEGEGTIVVFDAAPEHAGEGQPAFERLADVRPTEVAIPEPSRQALTSPRLPDRPEERSAVLPATEARVVPPERRMPAVKMEDIPRPQLDARRPLLPATPIEERPTVPALPPAAAARPDEPVDRQVDLTKRDAATPALAEMRVPPRALREPRPEPRLVPDPVPLAPPTVGDASPVPMLPTRRPPQPVAEIARTEEKVETLVAPTAEKQRMTETPGARVDLERREDALPLPPRASASTRPPLLPSTPTPRDPLQAKGDEKQPNLEPLTNPLTRASARPRLPAIDSPTVETVASPLPVPGPRSEKPLPAAEVMLPRPTISSPDSPSLPAVTGPRRPLERRPVIGPVVKQAVDGPPEISALEVPLTRRTARGIPVTPIPARFALRQDREKSVEKFGGSKASEAAVDRGLDWLAAHQNRDGSWSTNNFHANCRHPACTGAASIRADAAATGLAVLPFLGAGHTHRTGKHRQVVERALNWLIEHQSQEGALIGMGEHRPLYGHGIAAIALCEAYGMTKDPRLRGPAQKALDYIGLSQHDGTGGWRYTRGQPADTSVTGWQVMALRSGEMSGLTVPRKVLDGVRRWLGSVEGSGATAGRFGYQGRTPTPGMTAQGLLCLQLLGVKRDDPRMKAGADYLLQHLPNPGRETSYYWYHATQVLFHMQGNYWKAWNEKFRDQLVTTQVTQGGLAGSWNPQDARERTGGRLYATSLRLLMLEVYYRHLPLYQQLDK